MMKNLTTLLIALSLSITASRAASFSDFKFSNGDYAIVLNGDISEGTARAFTSKIETMTAQGKNVTGVFLNSSGGIIEEGVMASNAVKNYNLSTMVLPDEYCASACFLVLAAGVTKAVDVRARIGVHSAVNGQGVVTDASRDSTLTMARISAKYGVSSDIIDRMKATPPNEMAWLTADELKGMGVRVDDYVAQSKQTQDVNTAHTTTDQKNQEWDRYSNWAIKESARQNNGQANITDQCGPVHCETHLIYIDKSNRMTGVIVAKELDKKTIMFRQICRSTDTQGLKRTCTNWDSGEVLKQEYRASTETWVNE